MSHNQNVMDARLLTTTKPGLKMIFYFVPTELLWMHIQKKKKNV